MIFSLFTKRINLSSSYVNRQEMLRSAIFCIIKHALFDYSWSCTDAPVVAYTGSSFEGTAEEVDDEKLIRLIKGGKNYPTV